MLSKGTVSWWRCPAGVTLYPVRLTQASKNNQHFTAPESHLQFQLKGRQLMLATFSSSFRLMLPFFPPHFVNLLHYIDLYFVYICFSKRSGERTHSRLRIASSGKIILVKSVCVAPFFSTLVVWHWFEIKDKIISKASRTPPPPPPHRPYDYVM